MARGEGKAHLERYKVVGEVTRAAAATNLTARSGGSDDGSMKNPAA